MQVIKNDLKIISARVGIEKKLQKARRCHSSFELLKLKIDMFIVKIQ